MSCGLNDTAILSHPPEGKGTNTETSFSPPSRTLPAPPTGQIQQEAR